MQKTIKSRWWKISLVGLGVVGLVSAVSATAVACSATVVKSNDKWEDYLETYNYQENSLVTQLSNEITASKQNVINVPLSSDLQTLFYNALTSQSSSTTLALKNINALINNQSFSTGLINLVKDVVSTNHISLPTGFNWDNVQIASFSPLNLDASPYVYSAIFYLSYKIDNIQQVSTIPLYVTNLLSNPANLIAKTILDHQSSFQADASLLKLNYTELGDKTNYGLYADVLQTYFTKNNLQKELSFNVNVKDITVTSVLPVLLSKDEYGVYAYITYTGFSNPQLTTYPILFTGFKNFPEQSTLSNTILSINENSNFVKAPIILNYKQAGSNNNFASFESYLSNFNGPNNQQYFPFFQNAINTFLVGNSNVVKLPPSTKNNMQSFIGSYKIRAVYGVQTNTSQSFLVFLNFTNLSSGELVKANFPIIIQGNYKSPVQMVSQSILNANIQPLTLNKNVPTKNLNDLFSSKNYGYFNGFLSQALTNSNVAQDLNNNLPATIKFSDYTTYQVFPDLSSSGQFAYIRPEIYQQVTVDKGSVTAEWVDVFSLFIKVKLQGL